MKKLVSYITVSALIMAAATHGNAEPGPWEEREREMRLVLSEAYYRFVAGDIDGAKAEVSRAYTQHYKSRFEKEVKSRVSEERARNIDEWFEYVLFALGTAASQQEMREDFNRLNHLLSVTAGSLDGKAEPAPDTRSWTNVAGLMKALLDRAYEQYRAGNPRGAKDAVDEAYFQFYEKLGFEKTVLTQISGQRASAVEYLFSTVKKEITRGDPVAAVKQSLDTLSTYLAEDAAALDKRTGSPAGVFLGSLFIILREGFEAILIVGAIIAYLLKRGEKKGVRAVYAGSVIALAASVLLAWALNALISGVRGRGQEIIEGVTMLIAVAVLFYVSNWMVSKAESEAWTGYIKEKAAGYAEKGGLFSLTFAAFLAVFREGAETILFYQALLAGNRGFINMIWLGLAAGIAALAVFYVLIRVVSVKLPLKPFFMGTGMLLFVMSIAFAGTGVKELQEGNVVPVTLLPFDFVTIDLLGIYPTVETLAPQLALLVLTAVLTAVHLRKGKGKKGAARAAA
ncbi:MAG: FTR1 family iron permease [Spirochaetaceae bacterium]|jgi:high-affinity iron transporter|nr:FTR1 family iron permease [Spirochaetaceae bacterium]